MAKSRFYEKMTFITMSNSNDKERMVEDVYNEGIALYFNNVNIEHPFKCDGYFTAKSPNNHMIKTIIEYKYDENMKSRFVRAGIILQILFYLKRFEENGMILPNVVMVGDVNECFVFHVNEIIKWLDEDIDWSIAPSKASSVYKDFVIKIAEDNSFNPFIFDIDDNFSFKNVADKINAMTDNIQRFVHVTEHNIAVIFDYFIRNILNDKKVTANQSVSLFLGIIKKDCNYYQHPTKKNILVSPFGNVSIKSDLYNGFLGYFSRTYNPKEHMLFDSISDRLIEDTNRRAKGEFYTPTLFVDYAHKMIAEQFGENWKEEYAVWDSAWGTGNLTRDYYFNNLYASTLENAELEIGAKYNNEGTKFQFDFLNDPLEKLPLELKKTLEENKPIIFFINPPYARNTGDSRAGTKESVCFTKILEEMNKAKIGACSANLYAQFLYRIILIKRHFNLTNLNICLFAPTLFLTGSSWKNFRNEYLNEFAYCGGIQFQASHFSNVTANWGISFTLWRSGITTDKENFVVDLVDNIGGEIISLYTKNVYNLDSKTTANEWVKDEIKNIKTYDVPNLTNAINVKQIAGSRCGKCIEGAMGYFYLNSNNVEKNAQSVGFFSTAFSAGIGLSIIQQNFTKCTILFAARRLVSCNWINAKDEYLAPNTQHAKWNEFVNDSVIYSLFECKSQQSSLRQIDYKGQKWDIKNEFFFMCKDEMTELAIKHNNDTVYHDARTDNDRYVYKKIKEITLSAEAQDVLDKAKELVRQTFKYRNVYNEDHPEVHINTWDAGWYQIKLLLKEYMPEELIQFNTLFTTLSDKMRPMVYELGFLKK